MNILTFSIVNPKFIKSISLILTFLFSCNPKPHIQSPASTEQGSVQQAFVLIQPEQDKMVVINQNFHIRIKPLIKDIQPDSVVVMIGDKTETKKDSVLSFIVSSKVKKVGRQNLRLIIYYSDSLNQKLNSRIIVLSDKEPVNYKFRLIRTIPHDPTSYTQGLIFNDQIIYEGTGRNANSKLRKINPQNGEVIFDIKLDDEFFGEGITLLNNKIYQLTYRSNIGFIYDSKSFELLRKFDLQTVEGWGLTNDTKNLISSDGSSMLYFYDPEYITQVDQLDVCNHNSLVSNLNELEYVDGFIWANIYGDKYIVKVDARSGIITGVLNLESLFPKNIPDDIDHVLNGIAYNKDSKTYYITGKLWPVMYEMEILE